MVKPIGFFRITDNQLLDYISLKYLVLAQQNGFSDVIILRPVVYATDSNGER